MKQAHIEIYTVESSPKEEYEEQVEKNRELEREVESLQQELSKKQGQRGIYTTISYK